MKYLVILGLLFLNSCSWSNDRSKAGTSEMTTTFVWLPFACDNGKTYWLQNVEIKRYYSIGTFTGELDIWDSCMEK